MTITPLIAYVHFAVVREEFLRVRTRRSPRPRDAPRGNAAAGVLRRQRGLPLPRPVVRRPPVRARRRARRGVDADRRGGARLCSLETAVADVRAPRPRWP